MQCWQCGEAAEVFCGACRALQPPDPTLDHFARLGLESRFAQDDAEIAKALRTLQRKLHPDRFVAKGAKERRFSLEHATNLNDAVRAVRNPARRAAYLLKLRGRDIDSEGEGRLRMEPMFLMEIMELQEAIGELDGVDAHTERARLGREIAARYESLLDEVGASFDGEDEADLESLAQRVSQLRYLRRVMDRLETADAA
jgi:molecular chaperone HscB